MFSGSGVDLPVPRPEGKTKRASRTDAGKCEIGWIGDLLYHICTGCPSGKKLTENEGIVLVDEMDLHLHPDWQQSVIKCLSEAFPRIQFIFTSHSPLVTVSLEWANVWVMDEQGPRQLPNEPIYGLSADQVLLKPYFALDSTRPPEVVSELPALDQRAQSGSRPPSRTILRRKSPPCGAKLNVFIRNVSGENVPFASACSGNTHSLRWSST